MDRINEVSKTLLKRYVKKASGQATLAALHIDKRDDWHDTSGAERKGNNRLTGIRKAKTRMKEQTELDEGRKAVPLKGHPYHEKPDSELHYIIKDAGEAARVGRGLSSEGKYLDQVNDASTVLHYRRNGGKQMIKKPTTEDTELDERDATNKLKKDAAVQDIGKGYFNKKDWKGLSGKKGIAKTQLKRLGRSVTKHPEMYREEDELDEVAKALLNRYRQKAKDRLRSKGGINKALEKQDRDDRDMNPNRKTNEDTLDEVGFANKYAALKKTKPDTGYMSIGGGKQGFNSSNPDMRINRRAGLDKDIDWENDGKGAQAKQAAKLDKFKKKAAAMKKEELDVVDAIMTMDEIPVNLYIDQIETRCNQIVDERKVELQKSLFDFNEGHSVGQLRQAADAHRYHKTNAENEAKFHRTGKKKYGADPSKAAGKERRAEQHNNARLVADKLATKLQKAGLSHSSKLKKEDVENFDEGHSKNQATQAWSYHHHVAKAMRKQHDYHKSLANRWDEYGKGTKKAPAPGEEDDQGSGLHASKKFLHPKNGETNQRLYWQAKAQSKHQYADNYRKSAERHEKAEKVAGELHTKMNKAKVGHSSKLKK